MSLADQSCAPNTERSER